MACILFVYARTSIRAAKANAQRHRDADTGGEGLSLVNENRRRRGVDKKLDQGGSTFMQLASEARVQLLGEKKSGSVPDVEAAKRQSQEDERLKALRAARQGRREG